MCASMTEVSFWGLLLHFNDENYEIWLPDVVGGIAGGRSIDEAKSEIAEQLEAALEVAANIGALPRPSEPADVKRRALADLAECSKEIPEVYGTPPLSMELVRVTACVHLPSSKL
jgi:hypothetical protein